MPVGAAEVSSARLGGRLVVRPLVRKSPTPQQYSFPHAPCHPEKAPSLVETVSRTGSCPREVIVGRGDLRALSWAAAHGGQDGLRVGDPRARRLAPVYAMILRRLQALGYDWTYTFPRLYAVDLPGGPMTTRPPCGGSRVAARARRAARASRDWVSGGHGVREGRSASADRRGLPSSVRVLSPRLAAVGWLAARTLQARPSLNGAGVTGSRRRSGRDGRRSAARASASHAGSWPRCR